MKSYGPIIISALLTAWVLALPGAAKGQEADVAAMMAEIGQLTAEKEKNVEQIKIDLRAVQEGSREDASKQVERQKVTAESTQNTGEARSLIGRYGGKGDPATSNWVVNCNKDAGCLSQLNAINSRISATNAKRDALRAVSNALDEKSKAVTDKQRRNREIDLRISLLKQQIAFKKANASNSCRSECTGLANSDSAAQCMQACWDKGRSHTALPLVEQVQKPTFSMTPNGSSSGATPVVVPPQTGPRRTAEQAIEEYKASGAARPGPQSFRVRDVPPPKF